MRLVLCVKGVGSGLCVCMCLSECVYVDGRDHSEDKYSLEQTMRSSDGHAHEVTTDVVSSRPIPSISITMRTHTHKRTHTQGREVDRDNIIINTR